MAQAIAIERLGAGDVPRMRELNGVFADAFEDPEAYLARPPEAAYLADLLGREEVIVLVSTASGEVVGGLVAYELPKLGRAVREIYIYDLAVRADRRRRGIASGLIGHLGKIAAERGASCVFVQANHGDDPAIALYGSLGRREDVIHFDIPVAGAGP